MSDAPAAEQRAPARRELLSAETVFQIASLDLRARAVAEGLLIGGHRSKRFGSSAEFAEHKLYAPGDELRHLDWRAYARMDRYFVRRYEEEANLDVFLVVDGSGSMAYAGGARGAFTASKLDVACTLAAALAYVAHQQSDASGISIFAGDERVHLPPRARRDHLSALVGELEGAIAAGPTDVRGALAEVERRLNRRSLVVLFSDLLDVGTDALTPMGVLRQRGSDCLVVHTLDRDELEFPFDGVVRFEDLEGDREVQVDAPAVRDAYLEELQAFIDEVRGAAAERDVRYVLAPTDAPPGETLLAAMAGPDAREGA